MEIREEHLAGPDKLVLRRLRLLYLDDNVTACVDLSGARDNFRASCRIFDVGESASEPCTHLNQDGMPAFRQGMNPGRGDRNSVFVLLTSFGTPTIDAIQSQL